MGALTSRGRQKRITFNLKGKRPGSDIRYTETMRRGNESAVQRLGKGSARGRVQGEAPDFNSRRRGLVNQPPKGKIMEKREGVRQSKRGEGNGSLQILREDTPHPPHAGARNVAVIL